MHSDEAVGLGLLVLLAAACQSPAPTDAAGREDALSPFSPLPAAADGAFSAERAWAHLENLVALGPRPAGSAAAEQARRYLRSALEAEGLAVEERATEPGLRHLIGRMPASIGATGEGTLLLASQISTAAGPGLVGANGAASGPALLLELVRALASETRPYPLTVIFIEGDASPDAPLVGSQGLAQSLAEEGAFASVRAAIFVERVADAELVIARDLHSNHNDRAELWRAASALGHADSFSRDAFETPLTCTAPSSKPGCRAPSRSSTRATADRSRPGARFRTSGDTLEHCSIESLAIVGTVLHAGIARLETRLGQIDRFATAPALEIAGDPLQRTAASYTRLAPAPTPPAAPAAPAAEAPAAAEEAEPAATDPAEEEPSLVDSGASEGTGALLP